MPPDQPLLALRVGALEIALEAGRAYRIGSSHDCDLRIDHPDPVALFVHLGNGAADIIQANTGARLTLGLNGTACLSGIECAVVLDQGLAVLLPDPALREAARAEQTIPAAATPKTRRRDQGETAFVDMLANELRRAPWLGMSLLLHAFLFSVAWAVLGSRQPPPPMTRYGYEFRVAPPETEANQPIQVPVVPEPLESADSEPVLDSVPEPEGGADPQATSPPREVDPKPAPLMTIGGARLPSAKPAQGSGNGSGDGDVLKSGQGSGGFHRTVTELRRTGLDVVFVLDSTGSMGDSIRAAKNGIAQMLEVLRALVPDARFGLVTYRDRGEAEDYVVRKMPLCRDFYAAVNWMQSVKAHGGGDTPEAVLAGMRTAFGFDFRLGAKRVVILAGDAPPHPGEVRALTESVRQFCATGSSSVHTLLTAGDKGPAVESFAAIAKAGRGLCVPIADQRRLLRQVLTLAFGSEFEKDLDELELQIAADRSAPPTWARDLARRGGPELAAALRKDATPHALVNALLKPQATRAALLELVAVLASGTSSDAARQAAAHVLQMRLELTAVPIDPGNPRPIKSSEAAGLRQRVLALPE